MLFLKKLKNIITNQRWLLINYLQSGFVCLRLLRINILICYYQTFEIDIWVVHKVLLYIICVLSYRIIGLDQWKGTWPFWIYPLLINASVMWCYVRRYCVVTQRGREWSVTNNYDIQRRKVIHSTVSGHIYYLIFQ